MPPSAPLGSSAGDVAVQGGRRSLLDGHPEPKGPALKTDVGGASRASQIAARRGDIPGA